MRAKESQWTKIKRDDLEQVPKREHKRKRERKNILQKQKKKHMFIICLYKFGRPTSQTFLLVLYSTHSLKN